MNETNSNYVILYYLYGIAYLKKAFYNAYTETSDGMKYAYKMGISKKDNGYNIYFDSNLATKSTVTVSGNGYNADYT